MSQNETGNWQPETVLLMVAEEFRKDDRYTARLVALQTAFLLEDYSVLELLERLESIRAIE